MAKEQQRLPDDASEVLPAVVAIITIIDLPGRLKGLEALYRRLHAGPEAPPVGIGVDFLAVVDRGERLRGPFGSSRIEGLTLDGDQFRLCEDKPRFVGYGLRIRP